MRPASVGTGELVSRLDYVVHPSLVIGASDGAETPAKGHVESLVVNQRVDVVPSEGLPPAEEVELDQEADAHHLAAELLDEAHLRGGCAARGEQVVVDEHARPRTDRILVQLEGRVAVLECVGDADGAPRELARLARGDEAGAELVREGAA